MSPEEREKAVRRCMSAIREGVPREHLRRIYGRPIEDEARRRLPPDERAAARSRLAVGLP